MSDWPQHRLQLACVAAHAALLAWTASASFATRNEVAHLPAGIHYLTTGQFHAYRVNPPLARVTAAAPVLLYGANTEGTRAIPDPPGTRVEWRAAWQFADDNRGEYGRLIFLARLPGVVWSLVGLWTATRWPRELYGQRAALLVTILWCFGPNTIAHASLATPDFPCAVTCLVASYSFHRYLAAPSLCSAARAGVLLGLAQLTKFTALVDCLVWGCLALAAACVASLAGPRRGRYTVRVGHGLVIAAVCLVVVNLGYGYEGSLRPLARFDFVSRGLTVESPHGMRNAFESTWLGDVPVPLPANYVRGMDLQQADFEGSQQSYLRGELRSFGWWYFYLYALVVKVPAGTLLLGAAGLLLSLRQRFRTFEELVVWLPAFAVFGIASAKTGYTMHFRYVLPALPFALVGLSKVAGLRNRWCTLAVALLAVSSVVSSLRVYPHSLAYFNELAGGPENGDAHLIDSNIDWGQDLLRFKKWHDDHPEARPLHLAYTNFVDYRVSGLPELASVPVNPHELTPGFYAADIQAMYVGGHGYLRPLTPVARVGYTIRVYRLNEADIARLKSCHHPP